LFQEVARFAYKAAIIATMDNYDLIVCHDWMTVEAALNAKHVLHKPICLHIHATEHDRTGGHPNQFIYDLEKTGMEKADMIIANSFVTKDNCVKDYGINPDKIVPIHLAIENCQFVPKLEILPEQKKEKYVLFIARLTMQKGPEYFLQAAKLAAEFDPALRFIMAGGGDSFERMIHLAADMGLADKVFFTGFLDEQKARDAFNMADLFVMTSIAEPFGLTVLEAIRSGIPCIIPKNSGIAEILTHVIKVDFWDVREFANNIVAVLRHPVLHHELKLNSFRESENITWEKTAKKTYEVYRSLVKEREKVCA
jgi:glycosyltransferase involved in cell wall biosynthesis